MRKVMDFNGGWVFHRGDIEVPRPAWKGPVYAQGKAVKKNCGPAAYHYFDKPNHYGSDFQTSSEYWVAVTLPHDFVVAQDLDPNENNAHGYLHYDKAWYRKHFTLEPEDMDGKRVLLRFDGIAGKAEIYLNGIPLGTNLSTYHTFELDITDILYHDKENVLAVFVNAEEFEGWWYQGGGIYRNAYLTVTEPVAIDLWGVYAPAKKLDDKRWQIDLETTVVNTAYEDCDVTAETSILSADGECVATATGAGTIVFREKGVLQYSATVNDPLLWDTENPNLYTVKTVLKMNGEEIDENITRIGFRTVEASPDKGLLINGKKTFINGVCLHQDFGLTGLAVPDNILKYKAKLLKEMGANGLRTSHYQHPAAFMDAMDELGFLVMDEGRWFQSTKEGLTMIGAQVKRDRNRPSVIFWSTSNEEPFHITDVGLRMHRAIAAHIRKLDNTRFVMVAEDKFPEQSTVYAESDLIGINYNLQKYDMVHEQYPDKAVLASECCATGTSRDWNFPTNTYGRIRDKDADFNQWFLGREKTWKHLMERPYVIGCYQWIGVDHRGEADWPAISSKSGALDMFLQKKGAFYQNKSLWTNEPMVHIVPHWNFKGFEGQEINVTVYTNCDELELFLNGKSLGRKEIERYGHGEWNVTYLPGTLEVKAYREGKLVAEHSRTTTKAPASLRLTLNNEFKANGKDLALFTCEAVDEDGFPVPDAAEFVRFTTEKPAVIIGTGSDNCDHLNVALPERKMYMGKITVAVKPQKGQKKLQLIAYSDQCGATSITVECE